MAQAAAGVAAGVAAGAAAGALLSSPPQVNPNQGSRRAVTEHFIIALFKLLADLLF